MCGEQAGAAGDDLIVVSKNDAVWWTCRNVKSGAQGFMPANFVELA